MNIHAQYINEYFSFDIPQGFEITRNPDSDRENAILWQRNTTYIGLSETSNFHNAELYLEEVVKHIKPDQRIRYWVDSLAGWPAIRYKIYDPTTLGEDVKFTTDGYLFDNTDKVFNLNIRGYTIDSSIMYNAFEDLKSSFNLKTKTFYGDGFIMQAPALWDYSRNNYYGTIWTHLPYSGIPVAVMVYYNTPYAPLEDLTKDKLKQMKKNDYDDITSEFFPVAGFNAMKMTGLNVSNNGLSGTRHLYYIITDDKSKAIILGIDIGVRIAPQFVRSFEKLLTSFKFN
ncbi:MAG: hypothetical protein MUC31_00850 [Bacteroidales bacterium]|jgi:hypothetical protein|nr:hypothetical protein [Bacteroidales bacterium]